MRKTSMLNRTRYLIRQLAMAVLLASAGLAIVSGAAGFGANSSKGMRANSKARLDRAYGRLPLSFEVNEGQADKRVKFLSRGRGYTMFLTSEGAILALRKPEAVSQSLGQSPSLAPMAQGHEGRPQTPLRRRAPFGKCNCSLLIPMPWW